MSGDTSTEKILMGNETLKSDKQEELEISTVRSTGRQLISYIITYPNRIYFRVHIIIISYILYELQE